MTGATMTTTHDTATARDESDSDTREETASMTEESSSAHTIDDLAAVTKVPSRTIRFYQSKGLIPKPEIRGRVAYYGELHKKRLELIASLQDRGLRIDAIRELVGRIDKGELDVGQWLGVEAELSQSWAHDQPRTVTEAELFELVGVQRAGLLGDLARAGLVERKRDVYLVSSPALLRVVGRLEAAGIDMTLAVAAGEILRKHLGKAATELTDAFVRDAGADGDTDLVASLSELRPAALEAVRIIFAQQMERALRKLVESGKSATLPAKRRRPR